MHVYTHRHFSVVDHKYNTRLLEYLQKVIHNPYMMYFCLFFNRQHWHSQPIGFPMHKICWISRRVLVSHHRGVLIPRSAKRSAPGQTTVVVSTLPRGRTFDRLPSIFNILDYNPPLLIQPSTLLLLCTIISRLLIYYVVVPSHSLPRFSIPILFSTRFCTHLNRCLLPPSSSSKSYPQLGLLNLSFDPLPRLLCSLF